MSLMRRLDTLRSKIGGIHLDALIVTFLPHVRYLTGFSGSSGMCLITSEDCYFLSDGRYREQAKEEVKHCRVIVSKGTFFEEISKRNLLRGYKRIGFEAQYVSVAALHNLKRLLKRADLVPTHALVESIATIKDDSEIVLIKQAVAITDRVFDKILSVLRPGISERDVAAEIGYLHKKLGAEGDGFEAIVASGERGAFPHARASGKKLRKGELVTLDFGCRYKGYHSDLTRTVAIGKPSIRAKSVYQAVLGAQLKAIDAARAGLKAKDLDAVARRAIRKSSYGKYFIHSLGHGLGLQVHEAPRLSVASKELLQAGNVVTIEPGIYIPEFGGVRIEDDVVIRNGHCEVLNKSSKELIVL